MMNTKIDKYNEALLESRLQSLYLDLGLHRVKLKVSEKLENIWKSLKNWKDCEL